MSTLGRSTRRLYYDDPWLASCTAKVARIGTDYIELDSTVAYPEGGGQEADQGVLKVADGRCLRFTGAKKMYGDRANIPDFPDIQVGGIVCHLIHPDDQHLIAGLAEGVEIRVELDIERRAKLSLSHTASHFLYLGVKLQRPDAVKWTLGCHIKTDGARFDFSVAERFTQDDIVAIQEVANGFVLRGSAVKVYSIDAVPDARYWECESQRIACGGTHLDAAAPVGAMQVKRKCLGKGRERISCEFPQAVIDLDRYHY